MEGGDLFPRQRRCSAPGIKVRLKADLIGEQIAETGDARLIEEASFESRWRGRTHAERSTERSDGD
jgi:hypothetical protein